MRLEVQGQAFDLLKERALRWAEPNILILSDVHLGKAESLQSEGIAIPAEAGESDFDRLESLLRQWNPAKVLIVGDFVHGVRSWSLDLVDRIDDFFCRWQETEWHLIVGNHERGSLYSLEKFNLKYSVGALVLNPFTFHHGHSKAVSTSDFTIEGHFHPIVALRDGPLKLRMPCFVLEQNRLVLPAFGQWTGGVEMDAKEKCRYFACGPSDVFEVDK